MSRRRRRRERLSKPARSTLCHDAMKLEHSAQQAMEGLSPNGDDYSQCERLKRFLHSFQGIMKSRE